MSIKIISDVFFLHFLISNLRRPIYMLGLVAFVLTSMNEFFIYSIYRMSWNQLQCYSGKQKNRTKQKNKSEMTIHSIEIGNCTKMLFVADPQILGEQDDQNWYSSFAIWDCDRFLRNTFKRAIAHSWPDVVSFMGDLMDEGSIANTDEYERYLERFQNIFILPMHTKAMYIPGDNDVGGEGEDRVTSKKLIRFRKAFNEEKTLIVNGRHRFISCNMITRDFINVDETSIDNYVNIALSHMSILSFPGLSMKTVSECDFYVQIVVLLSKLNLQSKFMRFFSSVLFMAFSTGFNKISSKYHIFCSYAFIEAYNIPTIRKRVPGK